MPAPHVDSIAQSKCIARAVLAEVKNRDVKSLECMQVLQQVDGAALFRLSAQILNGKTGLRLPTTNPKHSLEPSTVDDLVKGSWMVRHLQNLSKLKAEGKLQVPSATSTCFYQECAGQDRSKNGARAAAVTYYEAVEIRNDEPCPAFVINKSEL